jgi:magnesium chelatase subunit I
MNPEEGELRPQLLDRFGLCVNVEGSRDAAERVEIMERRATFEERPEAFTARWEEASRELATSVVAAMERYPSVTVERRHLFDIASYCIDVGVDGHRGDIIMLKTAKTLAALHGRTVVDSNDIEEAAQYALPHRVRRQPLQDIVQDVSQVRRAARKNREGEKNAAGKLL